MAFSPVSALRRTVAITVCFIFLFTIAGCSPQPSETAKPNAADAERETTSLEFTWSDASDCSTCHENAIASFDDTACTASSHADQKADCFSCHADTEGLSEAHKKVTLDSTKKKATLKKTSIANDACISCHDKRELADTTVQCTVLTDKNGLVINPHALPEHEDHESITCSSCHKIHAADGPDEIAPKVCRNCHHADVYECNTCHVEK
ncbi:cytochrome c3 family protein [Raoultibacter phocaeensis]|uniref:cytochrome c3 family protein n=1 Tax=Raoultibacter phocaeensis TaxID=2479841 RepID=UPI001118D89A|nr:cytochrome c3 family protein [Raoultibacter phocaeensis]